MRSVLVHPVIYNSNSELYAENYLRSKLSYEYSKFIELDDYSTIGSLIDKIYLEYRDVFVEYFGKIPNKIYIVDHYIPPTQKVREPTDLSSGLVSVYDINDEINKNMSLLFICSFCKEDIYDFLDVEGGD